MENPGVIFLIIWGLLSVGIAVAADATNRQISFLGALLMSLLLSPVIGAILVSTSRFKDEVAREKKILEALQRIASAHPELPIATKQ